MLTSLMIFIAGTFLVLLGLNIYFRVKVFGYYKVLVKNRVEFGAAHIFNIDRLENEIISRYPAHANDIRAFVSNIRRSVSIAFILVCLIALLALILHYLK